MTTHANPGSRGAPAITFLPGRSSLLQRKCACGSPTSTLNGECAECKSKRRLQTKLAIGASNDPLEQEADRVADQVMTLHTHSVVGGAPPRIQRYVEQAPEKSETAPASVDSVLASPGRPLEPTLRQDMEQRFGHDFSRVRVHADPLANRSAQDVNANAYTVGNHVVFGAGRFGPSERGGLHLLAHELTHVVQQSQAAGVPQRVQRGSLKGPTTKPHKCGGWTCAPMGECKKPDGKSAPGTTPSTSWALTANIDVDVLTSTDINSMDDVGHAFVEFSESNGDRYTYGHYPNKLQLPSDFKPQVQGCTAHPDQTHSACVDLRIPFSLTPTQYKDALEFAQAWCIAGQPYHLLTNNCTTFVDRVVGVAGKTLPSSRGPVASGAVNADNPNTLFDAFVSQSDSAAWRQRVNGDFTGSYDYAGGKSVSFLSFELKTDNKYSVAGKYSYPGSSGDTVKGTLDGRLTFEVDPVTKLVTATVKFDWSEPGGSGKGVWTISTAGDLKGTWGHGTDSSSAGGWQLKKAP